MAWLSIVLTDFAEEDIPLINRTIIQGEAIPEIGAKITLGDAVSKPSEKVAQIKFFYVRDVIYNYDENFRSPDVKILVRV